MRLGYACINMSLESKFRTMRLANLEYFGRDFVYPLVLHNFELTKRILEWNIDKDIKFYRISSDLVPFGSHELLWSWEWWKIPEIAFLCKEIRDLVDKHDMRISIHPWQGNSLTTPYKEVLVRTLADLHYQTNLLRMFGGQDMILHVGGVYGNKQEAVKRFKTNLELLSKETINFLRIENDDKSYTIAEVFEVCADTGLLPVFDYHHDICLPSIAAREIIDEIPRFWGNKTPKLHLSTGADYKNDRKHSYMISHQTWEEFFESYRELSMDVMLECKAKELSVLDIKRHYDV